MTQPDVRRRRPSALRVATMAAVLAVSLVGAACGSGDEVPAATRGDNPSVSVGPSTTSTVDPAAGSTTTVGPGPTTTGRGATTTTTRAPALTGPPTTAPGPVALAPPAPGRYRYATSGVTTITGAPVAPIPFPPATTNTIDPPAGTRQHSLRDLTDPAGNGSKIDYTFDYRPDGMYLERLTFTTTVSGMSDVRDLVPPAPLLFLATGAAPGASRTLAIPLGTGGSANVVVTVTGTERVTVGGQGVDTLVVRSAATLPPGQVTGTQTLTLNLDKTTRLWVRERGVGDGTAVFPPFNIQIHSEYVANIQALTPG